MMVVRSSVGIQKNRFHMNIHWYLYSSYFLFIDLSFVSLFLKPYVDEDEHTNSIFKVEHSIKGENIYFKGPVNRSSLEELQAITYTPKHVWRKRRTDGLQLRPAHPRKGV